MLMFDQGMAQIKRTYPYLGIYFSPISMNFLQNIRRLLYINWSPEINVVALIVDYNF